MTENAVPTSMISPKPLRDTLAILCILLQLPTWLSWPLLLLYSLSGPTKLLVGKLASLLYKHKSSLGGAYLLDTGDAGPTELYGRLAVDTVVTGFLLLFPPWALRTVQLLSKAYVAASLASPKSKCTFNAFVSTVFVLGALLLENWISFYISSVDDSLENRYASYESGNFLTSALNDRFVNVVESCSAFAVSVLSVHIVLLNWVPSFPKFVLVNNIGRSLDSLATSTVYKISHPKGDGVKQPSESVAEEEPEDMPSYTYYSSLNSDKPIVLHIPPEAAHATLPVRGRQELVADVKTPASFPSEQQVSKLDEISSRGTVVAQNFENYCSLALFSQRKQDKKGKTASPRQQPLLSLVAAARTMFTRQDVYSGDSLGDGALLVAQGGISTSLVDQIQCFICYTGENAIGLELLGVSILQVLVRVNGVMWYQVTSGCVDGKEYVIVAGLTPLSQYDLEIINVNDSQEGQLLAKCTVSTVSKNMTLTQSKRATPLLTLQESLLTTNANVNREKLKLKKFRKEYSKRIHVIKNEIEVLKKKLYTNDKNDERSYRKILSLRQALTKLDQDNSLLEEEFMSLFSRETELNEQYLERKRRFETELRPLQVFESEFNFKMKEKSDCKNSLGAEKLALLQKREKLVARKDRLAKEVTKLEEALDALKDEDVSTRRTQREARAEKRQVTLKKFADEITRLERTSTAKANESLLRSTGSTLTLNSNTPVHPMLSPTATTATVLSATTAPTEGYPHVFQGLNETLH